MSNILRRISSPVIFILVSLTSRSFRGSNLGTCNKKCYTTSNVFITLPSSFPSSKTMIKTDNLGNLEKQQTELMEIYSQYWIRANTITEKLLALAQTFSTFVIFKTAWPSLASRILCVFTQVVYIEKSAKKYDAINLHFCLVTMHRWFRYHRIADYDITE